MGDPAAGEPVKSIHLTPGPRHRVTALPDTVMLEASTTEVIDVVRLEDRYGRQGTSVTRHPAQSRRVSVAT